MVQLNQMQMNAGADIFDSLKAILPSLTRQQRQAAEYLLDNPNVRLGSLRQLAADAGVTPNTWVRLARVLGNDGFESLRAQLEAQQARHASSPLERPDWLDAIADDSSAGKLLRSVADSALGNLERSLADADPARLQQTADLLLAAHSVQVLGVGTLQPVAKLFATLANAFMDQVHSIPSDVLLPLDAIAQGRPGDVLLAMTFDPYRREVVDAVRMARKKHMKIVLLTDSWKSPAATDADIVFMLPASAPHVFASVISVVAFLEVLLAFLIKQGGKAAATRIKSFHENRFQLGVYWSEE